MDGRDVRPEEGDRASRRSVKQRADEWFDRSHLRVSCWCRASSCWRSSLLAWRLRVTLLLILIGVFVAALLNPFVRFLHRRGMRRGPAVGVVYFVIVVVAVAFGYLIFHPLLSSANRFAHDLPTLVRQAQHGKGVVGRIIVKLHLENWVRAHVPNLESALSKLSKPAFAVGKTVVSGVVEHRHDRLHLVLRPARGAAQPRRRARLGESAPRGEGAPHHSTRWARR